MGTAFCPPHHHRPWAPASQEEGAEPPQRHLQGEEGASSRIMAGALELAFIDWQSPRNNREHHTAEIGDQRLIVRRGQRFTITLHFHPRGFLPAVDSLALIAEIGPQPEPPFGTCSVFPVAPGRLDPGPDWKAASTGTAFRATEVALRAPAGAPVGKYQLKARLDSDGASAAASYLLGEFILLFNPWCPEDDVFLEGEEEREEYVLNEHGLIYEGNKDWICPTAWDFGQFEEDVLDICLELLDRSLNRLQDPARDSAWRASPVYISRVMSALVNSEDDGGLLLGNWGEDYAGGVRPTEWTGSLAILRQWARTGGRPVKYGQCWVFAGVLCTVMRCLGIPTRVVTNFESAHEKDGDLVVDVYYGANGRNMPTERRDCIWNFHVWDECWMARRDLPPGFGGWQVVDGTPQERSYGLYCCGPASVEAIRRGEVELPYDTAFAFSMVNADRVMWLVRGSHKERIRRDTDAVGAHISTKAVGREERQDVTGDYKAPEGSAEERRVFQKATARRRTPRPCGTFGEETLPPPPPPPAQLALKFRLAESPEVGQDLQLSLLARNLASAYKEVRLCLSAQAVLHNGTALAPFCQESLDLSFAPDQEKLVLWRIPHSQYRHRLGDDGQLRVVAVGEELVSGEKTLAEKTITLASPPMEINVVGPAVLHRALPIQVEFANPLSEPVGSCQLVVEGGGLVKGQVHILLGFLPARAQASVRFRLTPFRSGLRHLHVSLRSSQFPPLKACKELWVSPCDGEKGRLP